MVFADHIFPNPDPDPGPVRVEVTTLKVSADFERQEIPALIRQALRESGGPGHYPLHLISALRKQLPRADLSAKVAPAQQKPVVKPGPAAGTLDLPVPAGTAVPFVVSGRLPADARPGEVYLVQVTAHYPRTQISPGRAVQYVEHLHVQAQG